MEDLIIILVLMGGSIKGMQQIACASELERTGKLNLKFIKLIVGTSVGAINGSLIAMGKTAKQAFGYFYSMVKIIFGDKSFIPPKYKRSHFVGCWNQIFPNQVFFSDAKIPLVITSVNNTNKKMQYFKSWKEESKNMALKDVQCKSFAAPIFFGMLCDDEMQIKNADGGCGEDNMPLVEAITEAYNLGWANKKVKFIAIGCGFKHQISTPEEQKAEYEKQKKQGWPREVIDYLDPDDGGMARAISLDWQIGTGTCLIQANPNWQLEYYNCEIPKEMDTMDNLGALDKYVDFGVKMAEKPLISITR